ncbi:hypothetical protein GQ44DRAFT_706368 [Phaeosphaeriaceae sp. PMI808]|nr:hypothetical protein GQ44DRAFT_706368 [Phaeosphaeriaceae sp. PMI808]
MMISIMTTLPPSAQLLARTTACPCLSLALIFVAVITCLISRPFWAILIPLDISLVQKTGTTSTTLPLPQITRPIFR